MRRRLMGAWSAAARWRFVMPACRAIALCALFFTGLGLSAACAPLGAQGTRQPPPTEPAEQPGPGETPGQASPAPSMELWIHGLGNPARLSAISARGVRMIVNMRKELRPEGMRRNIAQYEARGLGLVITLRWTDPNDTKRPVRHDVAPTEQEERDAIDTLIDVLNLPESKRMSGRLWVQFYNEVAGGPGTIMPEQADGLYGFATRTAERIRAEAPHIRICGPALTSLAPLEAQIEPGSTAELRRDGLLRAIRWSIENADAVDIHLHCSGGEDAIDQLGLLRRALQQAGKPDMTILSLEWSPARFAGRTTDLAGAQAALIDIYRAMAEHGVAIAAYSAFSDSALRDTYEWANLWDRQGQPHEPFYSLFKRLSETGETPTVAAPAAKPADKDPSEPREPRRRRNREGG